MEIYFLYYYDYHYSVYACRLYNIRLHSRSQHHSKIIFFPLYILFSRFLTPSLYCRSECTKFNVQFPAEVDEVFGKVENEFKTQSEQWEIYENFVKEHDDVTAEEWTVYRRRPYTLTDFISKWEHQLSNAPVSLSRVRIQNMLSRTRANLPVITMLQSDSLIEKHWAKIAAVLDINAKTYHEIVLKDVLNAMNNIEQNTVELQNIVRQATSEQIVRQAITELEQWGVTASLKTTVHVDSRGNSLTLIKDFQEVLNKVSYLCCHFDPL